MGKLIVKSLPVDELVRVKTLLRLLWVGYDAGGMSMGRSHEAVLLEAALELMYDIENEDISRGVICLYLGILKL